jgi:ElaA protein
MLNSDLGFTFLPFEELSLNELYGILHLRDLVFVVGQKITSEPEVDGRDPLCAHAMLYDGAQLVGTARVFLSEDPAVVGRVAVRPDRQGEGLGTVLMEQVQQALGARKAELHAQAHLEAWYTRLGWRRVGDVFVEAEIPHVMMVWEPLP